MSKEYHRKHPTISFRCLNPEEYARIKNMVKISGKSESTFIRELLLGAEVKESQSYNNGYNAAFNMFALPCPLCGKNMVFDLNNNPEATRKIYEIFGTYAHTECLELKKKQEDAERQKTFRERYFNRDFFY